VATLYLTVYTHNMSLGKKVSREFEKLLEREFGSDVKPEIEVVETCKYPEVIKSREVDSLSRYHTGKGIPVFIAEKILKMEVIHDVYGYMDIFVEREVMGVTKGGVVAIARNEPEVMAGVLFHEVYAELGRGYLRKKGIGHNRMEESSCLLAHGGTPRSLCEKCRKIREHAKALTQYIMDTYG